MYTLNPAFPTLTTGLHSRDSTLPESLPPSTPPIPLPLTDSPSPLPTDILRPLARTEDEYVYVDTELPQELRVALIRKGLLSLEGYPRSEEMREVLRRKALAKVVAVYTDIDSLHPGLADPRWAALFWSEEGEYVEVPWDLETRNLGRDVGDAAERLGEGI